MPYTPPSQQSPASSKSASPAISRTSSYSEDGPRSPVTGRPQLPRSHSSASYMSRQRRSPSFAKSEAPPTPTEGPDSDAHVTDFGNRGTVRQSPPPVNDLLMPSGAVISPPDSSENSDAEENNARGRDLEIRKLQEAVRSIDLKREGSPERNGVPIKQTSSEPVSQTTSPTALTAEARKISHSRSSTETAIIIPRTSRATFAESPTQTTDDSDEDDAITCKPSLVRKKSGELVKPALRPSSRRRYSSMPGTPTYSKSVHFNDNGNQTRHFLKVDKPMAVSAGSSPAETYDSETEYPFESQKSQREIKLANFPEDSFERKLKPIRVERLFLSSDRETLVGSVAVQNLAFDKLVVARFTLDYWKTTSEVVAEYHNDPRSAPSDGCDRFNFHIKLSDSANIDNKTLLLCVRYNVSGQEYWDNNDNLNYQIDFTKSQVNQSSKPKPLSQLGARPLSAIPRSRHSPPTSSHGRRNESIDDDFGARFDTGSSYHFGTPDNFLGESGAPIKLKPKPKRNAVLPTGEVQPHNNLGGRYDFGASLSAALSTAQDKLGRNSGLMNGTAHKLNGSYFAPQERKQGPTAAVDDKPEINGARPAMGSDQYRDLVQKFCYFTSSGAGKAVVSPQTTRNGSVTSAPAAEKPKEPQADGANDIAIGSASSSGSSSPSTPPTDGNNDRASTTTAYSPFISRSNSPSPFTGQDYSHRAASPSSFGYPYHSNKRDGYFDSPQPTAIRG